MKDRRLWAWILATVLLMAVSSASTWMVVRGANRSAGENVPATMLDSPQFSRFVSTYRFIRSQSIWRNSPNQLLVGATDGMVNTLHDQFTNYLSRSQATQLRQELSPSYVGIGIEAALSEPPVIDKVFSGSPADKAGLKSGDVIISVDGRDTAHMSPASVLSLIRGPVGSQVTVGVKQGQKRRTVTLRRRVIDLPTVTSRILPGGIAYLDIAEFGRDTGREAQTQFHALLKRHPHGIVLDLRDNPGGEVSQALVVANLFVPKGPVVTLKYKNAHEDVTYNSQGPGTRLPVVVLVNGETASAAEILSAAIQERQGGKLVGTRTYGKGIVQEVIPLTGGASLKLTVARYYTPDGKYIEHVGLRPNVAVSEPSDVLPSDVPNQDPQLKAAVQVLKSMMGK